MSDEPAQKAPGGELFAALHQQAEINRLNQDTKNIMDVVRRFEGQFNHLMEGIEKGMRPTLHRVEKAQEGASLALQQLDHKIELSLVKTQSELNARITDTTNELKKEVASIKNTVEAQDGIVKGAKKLLWGMLVVMAGLLATSVYTKLTEPRPAAVERTR